jgi:ectoine hydroxylase-related dioxygenase (phytanoyl-CoA dioxygenase family)
MTITKENLDQFEQEGYFVGEGILDPDEDLQPVVDEYDELLDRLAREWHSDGKLSSTYQDMSFGERLSHVARETEGTYSSWIDISLPQKNVAHDTPMHHGPAVFELLRNPKLLDAVEQFIGPEIFSNPVQHVRIKPPESFLPESAKLGSLSGRTFWHQDLGVVTDEADETDILTVWLPVTDATEENGCLVVGRRSHNSGLGLHCYTGDPKKQGIPEDHLVGEQVPVPMKRGDVLFMDRLTMHSSLPNVSDEIRWSFDLRYNRTGDATGRPWFPGFVARSRSNPDTELRDAGDWAERWREARARLAESENPGFQRWDPNDPQCA